MLPHHLWHADLEQHQNKIHASRHMQSSPPNTYQREMLVLSKLKKIRKKRSYKDRNHQNFLSKSENSKNNAVCDGKGQTFSLGSWTVKELSDTVTISSSFRATSFLLSGLLRTCNKKQQIKNFSLYACESREKLRISSTCGHE